MTANEQKLINLIRSSNDKNNAFYTAVSIILAHLAQPQSSEVPNPAGPSAHD